jgi:hypothetical protein
MSASGWRRMERAYRQAGKPAVTRANMLSLWAELAADARALVRAVVRAILTARLVSASGPSRDHDEAPPLDQRLSALTSPHGPPLGTSRPVPLFVEAAA